MTESEAKLLFEKINKKKETKEATQDVEKKTTLDKSDVFNNVKVSDMESLLKKAPLVKKETNKPLDTKNIKPSEITGEVKEGKKKSNKKYNPWAVCTSSVGKKDKKKYEDCVMGVKEKLKEGKNPYEYLIESKMEEIVENHLSPKISKKELIQIIQEKKQMMKMPIGKMMSMKGETMEGDTKTKEREKVTTQPKIKPPHPGKKPSDAPAPAKAMMMKRETMENETQEKTKEKEKTTTTPKTRPGSPNRNPRPDHSPAPAKAEQKKEEIINAITKLIGKGK